MKSNSIDQTNEKRKDKGINVQYMAYMHLKQIHCNITGIQHFNQYLLYMYMYIYLFTHKYQVIIQYYIIHMYIIDYFDNYTYFLRSALDIKSNPSYNEV